MSNSILKYNPNELVDVYDANGALTGEVTTKVDAKERLLYHKAVHIWIINDKNQILIQKRDESKKIFPGLWDISVAGHITSGDLPIDTAIREIKEELGIEAEKNELIYLYCLRRDFETYGTSNMFFDTFLYKTNLEIASMRINPREISELKFIDFQEFEKTENGTSNLSFAPRQLECKMLLQALKQYHI